MFGRARLIKNVSGEGSAEGVIPASKKSHHFGAARSCIYSTSPLTILYGFHLNRYHRHRRVTPPRSQHRMIVLQSGNCTRGSITHVRIRLQEHAHTRIRARTLTRSYRYLYSTKQIDALTRADWFTFASLDSIRYTPDRYLGQSLYWCVPI